MAFTLAVGDERSTRSARPRGTGECLALFRGPVPAGAAETGPNAVRTGTMFDWLLDKPGTIQS
jgi:hypothetical protein